jgi:RNA polymerase sigma-70 factor (ECF subfamily)
MVTEESIEILVSKLQKGDEQAFSNIYDKYSGSLYGIILKIVRNEYLAQDILQDCFINIWKKAHSYSSDKGTFFTWMLNICRNKSIDELRKINRTAAGKIQIKENNVGMSNGLSINLDTIGLKDMLKKLPEEQQLVIDFLYFRGYTQQEVSDELMIPLGTVKTRARTAVKELQSYFTIILVFWILKNI